ncbi:hypothetical protein HYALB_00000922 [Hymenoscyphus albidus]|uniref:Cytochrome P450 monooxygenase n=1 Tax=Hymenoscyphus albidus TaxID=595503 RepID=A0A9N9LE32_9HELO|nr:hypothetical protein HYALB_00000922 [Hymenoscyphus albidus]
MFSTVPVSGFILLFFTALYKSIIQPAFISPLSRVPNAHWSAPFSSFWVLWIRNRCCENRSLHKAHIWHGPVIRIAPNELSINDVNGLRTVYAGGFEKGEWYSIFDNYGVPCMFSAWHSRPHSARKRMISNIYSKSSIQGSPALAAQSKTILKSRLLPLLASRTAELGIDVHSTFNATTMDFITAYLFGLRNSSNFLQNVEEREHWLDLYHSRKTHTFWSQELPRITSILKTLGIRLVPKWVDAANQELEDWTKKKCDFTASYLKELAPRDENIANEPVVMKAMLSGISKEETTKGGNSVLASETLKFPELSVASEMIDHLAAGHETAGITLTYISWHLSQDVALQDKLRATLLTLPNPISLGNSGNNQELPNSRDLDNLPLLHAAIMETLRLDAAIPGSQPRMSPYPSSTVSSFAIPGGVRINAQAHSVHRNPSVYPSPETWDYTRWLDDENGYSEEQKRERDRWFWAFSSGGRMCVGSNFAMHEIKLIIAAIYTNFRTHIVNDNGIEQEDGYTTGPVGNKLILRFEKVVN